MPRKRTSAQTVLPYLRQALGHGWATVLACPNINFEVKGEGKGHAGARGNVLVGSESPLAHVQSLWEHIVQHTQHRILIAAHSTGGTAVMHLAAQNAVDFVGRVQGVVLLESVHKTVRQHTSEVRSLFRTRACNFVTSDLPLGHEVMPIRMRLATRCPLPRT
jgi:pimeloyl-ACP methyl ester carboxylesterase